MGATTSTRRIAAGLCAALLLGAGCPAWSQQGKGDDRAREMQRRLQAALKGAEEERAALVREIETLRQRLDLATAREDDLRRTRGALAEQARQRGALATELESVRSASEAAARRADELGAQLEVERRRSAGLQDRLSAVEGTLSERIEQTRLLAARTSAQEKRVAACDVANARLREAGLSCIARVQSRVIPGMEGIVQLERVRLENQLEAIRDELDAATLPGMR